MNKILIVCTANLIRSPLAAALLQKKLFQEGFEEMQALSAGTWAESGLPAHISIRALEGEYEIDLKEHRSRVIDSSMITEADVIYVMEGNHLEALSVEFPDQLKKIHLISSLDDQIYDIPNPPGDIASCTALAQEFTRIFDRALPIMINRHLEMENKTFLK